MSATLERWAKTCSYSLCRELLRAENTGSRATVTLSWGAGLPTLVLCKQQGISAFLASPPVSDDLIFGKIPIPPLFLVVKNKVMKSSEEEVFVQILKIFQALLSIVSIYFSYK